MVFPIYHTVMYVIDKYEGGTSKAWSIGLVSEGDDQFDRVIRIGSEYKGPDRPRNIFRESYPWEKQVVMGATEPQKNACECLRDDQCLYYAFMARECLDLAS